MNAIDVSELPRGAVLVALFNAARPARPVEDAVLGAPLVPVTRPALSHQNTGLACGHSVPRPLTKTFPSRLPCCGCAGGFPTDSELIHAAIDDAGPEERRRFRERLTERGPGLATTRPQALSELRAAAGGDR